MGEVRAAAIEQELFTLVWQKDESRVNELLDTMESLFKEGGRLTNKVGVFPPDQKDVVDAIASCSDEGGGTKPERQVRHLRKNLGLCGGPAI